jgi:hypothetical protein
MRPVSPKALHRTGALLFTAALLLTSASGAGAEPTPKHEAAATANPVPGPESFQTTEQAVDALIEAAGKYDVSELRRIFGAGAEDIYQSGEAPRDRQRTAEFADRAGKKRIIAVDPANPKRAVVLVGEGEWPFPIPLVNKGGGWVFDAVVGRQEVLNRRVGANELDAIRVCHGYVDAQYEYALKEHGADQPNQYAQRIISAPGKQDGLAWQNADGSWGGPVGENIARAIAQGYAVGGQPYHGYFFKILTGQGPSAPEGKLNFVVRGVMIGGFALAAAPAQYGVTGVKTFIVSHNGIVYEKDLGPASLAEFGKMQRFDPDRSWTAVPAEGS